MLEGAGFPARVLASAGILAAAALATLFSLWTASSGWSALRFLLAVAVLFLLPGRVAPAIVLEVVDPPRGAPPSS